MPKKLVLLTKTVIADTETPISVFSKLKKSGARFLLESAERGEQFGRYSIIMLDAQGELTIKDKVVSAGGELADIVRSSNPFLAVKEILSYYEVENPPEGFPLAGCIAGYFSYDCIRYIEKIENIPEDDLDFPDLHVYLFKKVLIYDHLKHALSYVQLIEKETATENEKQVKLAEMDALLKTVLESAVPVSAPEAVSAFETYSNMAKSDYIAGVEKIKHHIKEGDIFQCVLSRRRTYTPAPDPYEIYRKLRSLNPSPYMYYLDFENYKIVGSSPECLTRVNKGTVETFPIAGTRPRGKSDAEDKVLAKELLEDEKERAEHAMLVDLGRNDIGGISEFGTVNVHDYMHVEYFSHVMHLVTRVSGKLKKGLDGMDALMHCLPAGTVSGAPKIRAMEIIDDIEPTRRGPYAGAVGYIDFCGNMDMCITIRTLMFKDGCVHAQAGAGIVHDSVPEKEYEETESKLRALVKALGTDEIPVKEAADS